MKISSSTKFVLVTAGLIALGWAGWRGFTAWQLAGYEMTQIAPGRVSLIAVQPGAGYRIIVSNEIAQLAEVQDQSFGAPTERNAGSDVVTAKRLPIREMLASLQGDTAQLGKLVMALNDLKEGDLPPNPVVWRAEDISKALDGDATLRARLVRDLHIQLDGQPLATLRTAPLLTGIVLDLPVPVKVSIDGRERTLIGRAQEPFVSTLGSRFEKEVAERFNPSQETMVGLYRDLALEIIDGKTPPEDVAGNLRARISPERLTQMGEDPSRVLRNADVLLNETFIEGARESRIQGTGGDESIDVTIRLTPDGRMRLWKYSHDNPGFQLLLVVDGVAVAAPRITTALAQKEVTVTQVPSAAMAADAVAVMNETATKQGKP